MPRLRGQDLKHESGKYEVPAYIWEISKETLEKLPEELWEDFVKGFQAAERQIFAKRKAQDLRIRREALKWIKHYDETTKKELASLGLSS